MMKYANENMQEVARIKKLPYIRDFYKIAESKLA